MNTIFGPVMNGARRIRSIFTLVLCVPMIGAPGAFGCLSPACHAAQVEPALVRVVDLSIGEATLIELADGRQATVKLIALSEQRDSLSDAVRRAEVTVEVNGERAKLVSATYNLPQQIGGVQIDCSVTRGYPGNSRRSPWGLKKDARLRVWPANSPWIRPDTFAYPAKQRWFATHTQMANVHCGLAALVCVRSLGRSFE